MFVTCAMLQSIAVEWPEDKHDQLPGRLCCAVCSFGSTGNFARLQQSFCFLHLGLQNIVGCGLGLGAWKLLLLERSICGWSGGQRPAVCAYSGACSHTGGGPSLVPAWSLVTGRMSPDVSRCHLQSPSPLLPMTYLCCAYDVIN